MYALPATVAITIVGGFVIMPSYFILTNRKSRIRDREINKFVKKYSVLLNIKKPVLYAVDKSQPMAFSFRSIKSSIFMSTGMIEITNKKEKEAILLHELAHLKQRSSAMKFSANLMRIFSPLSIIARFHHDNGREESDADRFVIDIQGTDKYLKSTKRKINMFKD